MDREKIKMIRGEIEKALNEMGQKFGLTFSLGTITFTEDDLKVQIRGISTENGGKSAMELDWDRFKGRYPELARVEIGAQFRNDKGVYQIVGLKPRNRKYPVIAKRLSDGKQFKFSPYSVSVYMGDRVGL